MKRWSRSFVMQLSRHSNVTEVSSQALRWSYNYIRLHGNKMKENSHYKYPETCFIGNTVNKLIYCSRFAVEIPRPFHVYSAWIYRLEFPQLGVVKLIVIWSDLLDSAMVVITSLGLAPSNVRLNMSTLTHSSRRSCWSLLICDLSEGRCLWLQRVWT